MTDKVEELEVGARDAEPSGQRVYRGSFELRNPKIVDGSKISSNQKDIIRQAKEEGHDAVIFEGIQDSPFEQIETDQIIVFDADQIKTKQQLTSAWKQSQVVERSDAQRVTREKYRGTQPTVAQLSKLASDVKELQGVEIETIVDKVDELSFQYEMLSEQIDDMPGKVMQRYISRKEGEFLDPVDPNTLKTPAAREKERARQKRMYRTAESAFEGTELTDRFDDPDAIRDSIDEYREAKKQLESVGAELQGYRAQATTIRKAKRAASIGMQQRRMQYRATQARYNLTDNEMKKFLHGRNISAMDSAEWTQFMKDADEFGQQQESRSMAMLMLEATLNEKELVKHDNLRLAMEYHRSTR